MRDLVVSLTAVLTDIEREKGRFEVKCLVARDPVEPLWDLVLAADWFWPERRRTLDFLTARVMGRLEYEELMQFAGLVIYSPDSNNPLLVALRKIQEQHRHHHDGQRLGAPAPAPTGLPQARLVIPLDDLALSVQGTPERGSEVGWVERPRTDVAIEHNSRPALKPIDQRTKP